MGFLIPPEHHIPLWPNLGVLQIGIRAKVIENQISHVIRQRIVYGHLYVHIFLFEWTIIPLVNADELPEMDLYEEVSQQGQAHLLSPAYVPNPMELNEHVPIYVPEPKYPEYHAPSDDDIQESMEEDSINYPDEPKDDDEDSEEDPEEDHTDYPANGEDGDDEPSDDDDDDDDTDDEDEEPTEDEEEEEHLAPVDHFTVPNVNPVPSAGDTKEFEADKSAPTPRSPQTRVPFSQTHLRKARMTVRLEPPMSASMEARIAEHAATPIPPTRPAYDQAPLGHRAAIIRMRDDILEDDMPPWRIFVFTAPPPGCDVAESSVAAARPTRAAERAEDVGYLHDTLTDRGDIRLEIDVVRDQRTAYETELHERAEDDAVRQMMRTYVLEARAQIDTVEDTDKSC
ncbi:hypothetical protein Tco_1172951 [Tanacetum coccineum]